MATANDVLIEWIDDAYAMEREGLRLLEWVVRTTEDPQIRLELLRHRSESEQQVERLKQRLEAHGRRPPAGGGATELLAEIGRSGGWARPIRTTYALEHLEIATYELLERFARANGDAQTAHVAVQNRREEEEMARRIASRWDRLATEDGVTAAA